MNTPTLESTNDDFLIAQPGEPIVNITPFTARQKVNSYVGDCISHMMGSDEPALRYSQGRLIWRVPVILTSPFKGTLGIVGYLDVDARTGRLFVPANFVEEVQANARPFVTDHALSPTE
ncbi:MAG: hypothetical protein IPL78_25600 [Chloroflexi bacterium]|nr:hypothetical protein [Chloroflexota bacterium]